MSEQVKFTRKILSDIEAEITRRVSVVTKDLKKKASAAIEAKQAAEKESRELAKLLDQKKIETRNAIQRSETSEREANEARRVTSEIKEKLEGISTE